MHNITSSKYQKFLPLLHDKAENMSKYSGISWMICKAGKVLALSGSVQGLEDSNIFSDIMLFGKGASVYLSFPPNPLFINAQELTSIAIKAGVSHLVLPELKNEMIPYLEPIQIHSSNLLKVTRLSDLIIRDQPYITAFTFIKHKRPWITCITSDVESNKKSDFDNQISEFGVLNHTQRIIKENQACAVENQFSSLCIKTLQNNVNQDITFFELDDYNSIECLIHNAYKSSITSLVIIISPKLAAQLIKLNLLDEIIYYQAICKTSVTNNIEKIQLDNSWTIQDCNHFNKGIRFRAKKSSTLSFSTYKSQTQNLH